MSAISHNLKHIDRLFHEPSRLAIAVELLDGPKTFKELQDSIDMSDGNLAVHARKMEDAECIKVEKSFQGRIPQTRYTLTPEGRAAAKRYTAQLQSIATHLTNVFHL